MANVWKIGTRWSDWGDPSASVLSIMRRNNLAFVRLEDPDKSKFLNSVKKGDYIALADDYQIVAIGKATGNADYLRNFKNFYVSSNDYEHFSLDDGWDEIVAVKINIVDIEDDDKAKFWYEKRYRFCFLNQLWEEVIEYYDSHLNRFSIQTYTGTSKGVYYSTNEGRSWSPRYSGSSCGDFSSLADGGKELLANTSKGLYYSTNGGRSWSRRS